MDPAEPKALVEETFNDILSILQQLSVYLRSPKFFIIYAHENHKSDKEPNKEVVQEYISWFKRARFNVDSDRSPHGFGPLIRTSHKGASVDIVTTQLCLLPLALNKENVDYVLVFYSELLAEYMEHERKFDGLGLTYSDALSDACKGYRTDSPYDWGKVTEKVREVQKQYSNGMKDGFHHVMTEMALLRFRNENCSSRALPKYTIPITISQDGKCPKPKWEPVFVGMADTELRLELGKPNQHKTGDQDQLKIRDQDQPETGEKNEPKTEDQNQPQTWEKHELFFKILLMFETLENDRLLIEVLRDRFKEFVKLVEKELMKPQEYFLGQKSMKLQEYRIQWKADLLNALDDLIRTKQGWMIQRQITTDGIRKVLNLRSWLDCKSIQRVSGEKLPENLSDIDLVVRNEKPKPNPGEEKASIVSLHSLFDERQNEDGDVIHPKRIFILGRPGIGKTTLCKRIMYEYYCNENLQGKFELVVRVPVRKFEHSTSLSGILFDEYFCIFANGREMSSYLENLILGEENANKKDADQKVVEVLIILDGLDEAPQVKRPLLKKLMSRPVVITTSRSYDPDILSIDLKLDAQGLSIAGVEAYLENTAIVPDNTAKGIRRFIESNPFLKEMVQVPIHLDILCYSWDDLQRQSSALTAIQGGDEHNSPTITALYQAVVRTLWRKDIPNLGKLDHGEPVTTEIVNAIRDTTRLERLVHTESDLLGEIAIYMMESDLLEITDRDIGDIIRRLEINGTQLPLSLERNLRKLSFLCSYSGEDYWRYSFVHFTFQEFFAARYLVRNRNRIKSHLRKHKYNRRYEIVWRFVPGLLSDAKDLNDFFDLLEQEPRDLIGTQHINLTMHCLSECRYRIEPSHRNTIQNRLAEWLRLEIIISKWCGIGTSMAFPDNILCDELFRERSETEETWDVDYVLLTIMNRTSLSENLIRSILRLTETNFLLSHIQVEPVFRMPLSLKLVNDMQNDIENGRKKEMAVELLRRQAKLPEATTSFFMNQIQSRTKLEQDAQEILTTQHHLSEATILKLRGWLESDDLNLRSKARGILSRQSMLSIETVDFLLDWFERAAYGKAAVPGRDVPVILSDRVLQPDAVKRLGTVLQQCIDEARDPQRMENPGAPDDASSSDNLPTTGGSSMNTQQSKENWNELKVRVAEALENQPNLPTNILEILVKLLCGGDMNVSHAAARVLERQPNLPTNILEILVKLLCDKGMNVSSAAARVLERQPNLPTNILEIFEKLLCGEDINISYVAVRVLGRQPNLPTNILEILMKLLCGRDMKFSHAAATVLQNQSCLHYDTIEKLRGLFKLYPEKTVFALKGRLNLLDDPFTWLVEQIAKRNNATISGMSAHVYLSGEFNLPSHLVEALLRLVYDDELHPSEIGMLIGQRRELTNEVIDAFVNFLCSFRKFGDLDPSTTSAIYKRPAFVEPLIAVIEKAEIKSVALDAGNVLAWQKNLDPALISRLGALLVTESTSKLEASKSRAAAKLLCQQFELPPTIISALHDISKVKNKALFKMLWEHRHIEQFCANLETFDSSSIWHILRDALLKRHVGELTAAYIDGDTLWFYTTSGKLTSQHLRNEETFRKRFRKAQEKARIPQWAWIKRSRGWILMTSIKSTDKDRVD